MTRQERERWERQEARARLERREDEYQYERRVRAKTRSGNNPNGGHDMTQAYSDPSRENDPYSLPNIEVFYNNPLHGTYIDGQSPERGWYWWSCFPGCLPDSDPIGPFATEAKALEDAQDY